MNNKPYATLTVTFIGERDRWGTREYGKIWRNAEFWWLGCPRCGYPSTLQHRVDVTRGKATLNPSVVCVFCDAHFYVDGGVVKPV